jgi:hypothetical protein
MPALDFYRLSDRHFELLIADLLGAIGLSDIQIQPPTTPTFDIIASETLASRLQNEAPVRWGIQCKLQRSNVGPAVLDNLPDEAINRRLKRVLLASASDFTPRTILRGEQLSRESLAIESIVFWNERRIKQQLVRHPYLLTHHFGVDFSRVIPTTGRPRPSDLNNLFEYLGHLCGVPLESMVDTLVGRDLRGFLSGTPSAQLGGDIPSQAALAAKYRIVPGALSGLAGLDYSPPTNYDSYRWIKHVTRLEGPIQKQPALRRFRDAVQYETQWKASGPLVFEFVTSPEDWNKSHNRTRNEYTWQMARTTRDLSTIVPYIKITQAFVGGVRLGVTEREVSPNKLRIVLDSPLIHLLDGQTVQVSYTVQSVRATHLRSLISSLHAPTAVYTFTLMCDGGFKRKPRVSHFLGDLGSNVQVTYDENASPPAVTVLASGGIGPLSGVALYW